MAYYDSAKVTIHHDYGAFRVYGREFPFPGRGDPSHFDGRAEALKQAKSHGCEVLGIMAAQKGAPLSRTEEIRGVLDTPKDTRPIREQIVVTPGPQPVADNPYADHLGRLRGQAAHNPNEAALKARRMEMYETLATGVEQAREAARIKAARDADPTIKNMREHAQFAYEAARMDRNATVEEVTERRRLLDLSKADVDPKAYWSASDEAHAAWTARLDAMAAEKQTAADAAKLEARTAKTAATLAEREERPEVTNES